jgi:hypothetical protein
MVSNAKRQRIPFGCMLVGMLLGALLGYYCMPYRPDVHSGRGFFFDWEAIDRRVNYTLAGAALGAIVGTCVDVLVNGWQPFRFRYSLAQILLLMLTAACIFMGIRIYVGLQINPLTW